MKFLCDEMLGRLARWLRIAGYDTEYCRAEKEIRFPGTDLVRRAREEGRLLLTRDRKLKIPPDLPVLMIESDHAQEQLAQVMRHFSLLPQESCTRCPVDNGKLREMEREEARGSVPPYVFQTQKSFSICEACGRIYWAGTHFDRITERLEEICGG